MASPVGEKIPSGYKKGSIQQFDPRQMQLYESLFQHAGPDSFLSRLAGGDERAFSETEAPAYRAFNQQIGQLSSRFSGMGMGARKSSGFQNTATQAASDFSQDLASRRQALQFQALQELRGMSSELLGQRPYQHFLIEKQQRPSFGQQLLSGVAPLAGAAIGGFAGGPAGAAMGAQLGSAFGSGISGGQPAQMNFQGISDLPTSW